MAKPSSRRAWRVADTGSGLWPGGGPPGTRQTSGFGRLAATGHEAERLLGAVGGFELDQSSREPDAGKRRAKAWALACQADLAANEFVYVE